MFIRLFCPNLGCRTVLEVPDRTRGKRVRCGPCGMTFLVPAARGGGAGSVADPERRNARLS